ncbi:hypothetical protein VTJ83DRAFT_1335 [Remersonia thermophila]|uniref:MOSC domain-containing protein n=1 Tax=Remersonia thermophila TaxID=72144 RepID=A0ABR4DRS5_9PEZI
MKITGVYVYPIKALRGIRLESAHVGPQGIRHDRRFMLLEVRPGTGELRKIQLDTHPRCALFEQAFVRDGEQGDETAVSVRFLGQGPQEDAAGEGEGEGEGEGGEALLRVPLAPDTASLAKIDVDLHGSPAKAYRMGDAYDAWFGRRFGIRTVLVYIGDGRRAVLGRTLPPKPAPARQGGWISSVVSYVTGTQDAAEGSAPWIAFSDVAPLLVTSEASLGDVRDRLLGGHPVEMYKFRPNLVVDGQGEGPWAEDFWAELTISGSADDGDGDGDHGKAEQRREKVLQLTGNCVRCTSLNVDYRTGRPGEGQEGSVLKSLMKDRRVDAGSKWSPVFGRYAFLGGGRGGGGGGEGGGGGGRGFRVSIGDDVRVTRRNEERSVWDWPGL